MNGQELINTMKNKFVLLMNSRKTNSVAGARIREYVVGWRLQPAFGLLTLSLFSSLLPAATIPLDLCNTGFSGASAGCGPLGTIPSVDGNWTLFVGSTLMPNAIIGDLVLAGLNLAYLSNDAVSQWLGVDSLFNGASNQTYTYRTSFNIPIGADLSTVLIKGRWRSDNEGQAILANMVDTLQGLLPVATSFSPSQFWAPFTITSTMAPFVEGLNILDFRIRNRSGFHGGRIEFDPSSSSVDSAVPEPGTFYLLGTALVAIGVVCKRRNSASRASA